MVNLGKRSTINTRRNVDLPFDLQPILGNLQCCLFKHIMSTGIIIIFTWSCPEFVYGCRWYTSAPCLQDKLCKHYVHTRLLYQCLCQHRNYVIMKYVDMREIMST